MKKMVVYYSHKLYQKSKEDPCNLSSNVLSVTSRILEFVCCDVTSVSNFTSKNSAKTMGHRAVNVPLLSLTIQGVL